MRSGPIKCLVCTVQCWETLICCMPWERFHCGYVEIKKSLNLLLHTSSNWSQTLRFYVKQWTLSTATVEKENVEDLPIHESQLLRMTLTRPLLVFQDRQTAFLFLQLHNISFKTTASQQHNRKCGHLPATFTFSAFVALGVAVLALLVRFPPVPL